jgi:hypothetical protein
MGTHTDISTKPCLASQDPTVRSTAWNADGGRSLQNTSCPLARNAFDHGPERQQLSYFNSFANLFNNLKCGTVQIFVNDYNKSKLYSGGNL